jgi:uncharacterized protein YndB with AHSA1/START domain
MDILEIKAGLQIQKPAAEVFEAIVDPAKMSNYFISKSSGRMEEGKTLQWNFPEFKDTFPIRVGKIEKNKLVSWYWSTNDKELLVEIKLETQQDGSTLVNVTEGKMKNDDEGIKWLGGNTEGWANFLACMKAYLEYGINLRKGAFIYRGDK